MSPALNPCISWRSPVSVGAHADSAYPVYQGCRSAAAVVVYGRRCGRSGEPADVCVARGVYDHLCEHCLAAFLRLEDDAFALVVLHYGPAAPRVIHHPDPVGELIEHQVHLYLELCGLYHESVAYHLRRHEGGAAGSGPCPYHERIEVSRLFRSGAVYSAGYVLKPCEPFLLYAPYVGLLVEGEVGDKEHVSACDVSAAVAVALHQDDVLAASSCGSNGCGMSRGAAAYYQHVAFVVYRYGSLGFNVCLCAHVQPPVIYEQ